MFADGSMIFMQIIKEDAKIAFEDDSEKLSKKSLKPAEVLDHTFDVEGIPIEYFGGCVLTKARLELPVMPADNAARVNRDLCSSEHKHKSIHRVECFKKYSITDLYQLLSQLKHTNPSAAAKLVCLSESLDSFFHALHSSSWRFDFQIIHCPLSTITERATKDMPAQGGH